MKNAKQLLTGLIIILSFTLGCSSDDTIAEMMDPPPIQREDPKEENPPTGDVQTVSVQIKLPQESTIDVTTTTVFSQFEDFDVGADGSSKATHLKDGRSLAMLRDGNGETLLMGFINANKKELSISSTLEAVLFYGLGTVFLPEEIKEKYMAQATTLPGFANAVTATEAIFAENANFLGSDAFNTLLEAYINELTSDGETLDPAARLNFSGDIRSGIRLEEKPGNSIILVNKSRRRAHAFFYKVSSKDLNGVPTTHITDIVGTNASAEKNVIVGPTFAIASFIGVLQNQASGKGIEVARKDSDPTVLGLADNEIEALYKVRVIGPSITPAAITNQEDDRKFNLEIETLGFDIALPVLMSAVGGDNFLKDFKASQWSVFLKGFELLVSSLPPVNDALIEGDLDKAQREFFNAMSDTAYAGIFEDLFKALLDNLVGLAGGLSQENSQLVLGRTASFFKALKVVDIGLQYYDFGRIFSAWKNSNSVEEWEVTATRNKVSLDPRETLVIQGELKTFKATIQDSNLADGQSYEFRWSNSGLWGELRGGAGQVGSSFSSSSDQVEYFSSNIIDVPEGTKDSIQVEVYIKQGMTSTRVGAATAKFDIKAIGFEIVPDKFTIQGNTNLKLYVKRTDGTDPVANSSLDYRFVWYTPAQFGLFNGSQSSIDINNNSSVLYSALELEEEGVEEIQASIYARRKGTTDRFQFVDKIDATINIENDPYKKIFYINKPTIEDFPPSMNGIYCEWSVQAFYKFKPLDPAILEMENKEIVQYKLTIKAAAPDAIPSYVGMGETWIVNGNDLPPEQEYSYRYSATGSQGGACTEGTTEAFTNVLDFYNGFAGFAEVVVTLKDKD